MLSDSPYDADPVPTVQYASLQLYIHAVVAGVLATVVDDGVDLLRSRERSFSHALAERPTDDPLLQRQLGELASVAYIARTAVLDAAEAIGAATDSEIDGVPDADAGRRGAVQGGQGQGAPGRRRSDRGDPPAGARRRQRGQPASATWTGTGATSAPSRCTTRWASRRG